MMNGHLIVKFSVGLKYKVADSEWFHRKLFSYGTMNKIFLSSLQTFLNPNISLTTRCHKQYSLKWAASFIKLFLFNFFVLVYISSKTILVLL
jgi:hypothetical protein